MTKAELLEIIDNEHPNSNLEITLVCDEFTCLCPWTAKPGFATLTITYTPTSKILEMISLKNYLASYSNTKIIQEFAVDKIRQDLYNILEPKNIVVKGEFSATGGIRLIPISSQN